ncbi:MAG: hypothetical protein ACHQIL_00040 [Steroidobacterales bacterium]
MPSRGPASGRLGTVAAFAVAISVSGSPSNADGVANWTIQPPAQATVVTTASLTVGVPANLSAQQVASLAVEIDHIDVTALAVIGGGSIAYRPPQPFEVGSHELRVVEYANGGRMLPRGEWRFSASLDGKTGATRGWSVKGNIGGTASERVAESNLTPPAPPRFTINGTFDVKAARTMSEWTAEASMNGLYGTDNGTSAIAGQAVQPGQMQLALKRHKDSLIVGDQTLPFDNLLVSGLSRRGISGHLADMPLGMDATAFSVRDSSLAGFYGGLGVGDSSDIVSGGVIQSHPIPGVPKALTLQVGYVTGSSPGGLSTVMPYPGGNNTFPPNTPLGTVTTVQSGSGNAWGVGVNSEIPGSTLHLNGQFANSSFDFPGTSGQSATRAGDDAYSYGLGLTQALGKQWNLTVNASYQDIGTYFTSLANPTLSPDRRTANATGTLASHGFALTVGGGFTEDNTDDNAAIATVRSLPRNATLSYAPTLPSAVTAWLGSPSLNLAWQGARTHNVTAPVGSEPTDSDVVNDSLGFNFAYPHFSWQAGLTGGRFRDYTGQQDDTDTFGPTAGINVTLAGKGFLGANLQLLDAHDLKNDTHTLDRNYSLTGSGSLLHDQVTAQLTLSVNHNTQQIVPGIIPPQLVGNDVVLKTATAQILWHALPATRTRGGMDIGLSSSWNDSSGLNSAALTTQGFSALAMHGFQGFLTVAVKWPLAMGDP